MSELSDVISTLRELNEAVPKPMRLPTPNEVLQIESQAGVSFHPDLRHYLFEASDVVFSTLEPVTLIDPELHTHFPRVLVSARALGVPDNLVPFCEDNSDYYCIDGSGQIEFWSPNGSTDESWDSLADWISEVWIGEADL